MTRVIGPTGSRRRRRFLLVAPLVVVAALVLAIASAADNTELAKFEIDGNLVYDGNTTPPANEDWVNSANTGADDGTTNALKCITVGSCTATNYGSVSTVTDGAGAGNGELFRDWLKVGDDTTSPTFKDDQTTFTQGDKENDFGTASNVDPACTTNCVQQSPTPWHIVHGATPPNKDDLFDVATNTLISGTSSELDLGMVRTNNNGSSHLDFELNRQNWLAGGGDGVDCLASPDPAVLPGFKCPKRTEGDLLISFEINPDGTASERFFVWDLPGGTNGGGFGRGGASGSVDCEGAAAPNKDKPCPWEEISPPTSSGGVPTVITSVNAAAIDAPPWGFKNPDGTTATQIPKGGWFEAGINLSGLGFPPSCPGFGTGSAKARSSGDSVTSALTDLAGPFPINLNNCAKLHIIKDAQPDSSQIFSYTTTGTGLSGFNLVDDGVNPATKQKDFNQLSPGSYTVTEGSPGGGYALTSDVCVVNHSEAGDPTTASGNNSTGVSTITLGGLGEVTCTYTNVLQRSLIISKVAKDASTAATGNEPLGGVTFSISPNPTGGASPLSVTDLFAGEASGTDQFRSASTGKGKICVDIASSVAATSFSITETVPTGYSVVGTNPRTGVTPTTGTCASRGTSATADAAFVNTPLSTITVSFTSQATGASGPATAANINCSPAGTTTEQNLADPAFDDTSETFADLAPGQVICTINIDP